MRPNKISYPMIFRLKNNGSIRDAKKAPVENIAKVIDIFETLIAAKKVIQCNAMMIPATERLKRTFNGTLKGFFLSIMYPNIKTAPILILYQTRGIASKEISSPNTAVIPAITTRKCRWM